MATSQDPSTSQSQSLNTEIPEKLVGNLKFIHINLNHCKANNESLKDYVISVNADVALLQDAYYKGPTSG